MNRQLYNPPFNKFGHQGFTLVELMMVIVLMSILLAIAIPSYQEYVRRVALSQIQQEMLKISEQLERHKARNFSYKGFSAEYLYKDDAKLTQPEFNTSSQILSFPLGKPKKYELSIVDGATGNPLLTASNSLGQSWAIQAESTDPRNFNVLLTSMGIRCKNKNTINYDDCSDGEAW